MSGTYGFDWTVGDWTPVTMQAFASDERAYIDCPRGTKAGKACFYFRRADALAMIAADSYVTIQCVVKRKALNDQWQVERVVQWKGYLPTECSEIDESGNCWVTLRDKRIELEKAAIDQMFNALFLMTWESNGTTQYKFYDEEYCQALNVPFTFDEIIDQLFGLTTLIAPALPVSPDPPDNILACGSVSEVLAGLLATQGCDLVYDPFSEELTIVLLSDNQDTPAITAAQNEGRLIHREQFTLTETDKHGKVVVWPREWYPIINVTSDSGTFGVNGKRTVHIRDHALADETTKTVQESRMTAITEACNSWFRAESDLRDESYFGIVEQSPGEEIRVVQWWLPDHSEDGYQMTRVINNSIPIPWIQRVENKTPPSIRGSASSTGLGTTVPELFFYWISIDGGGYTNSGYYCRGISTTGEIEPYAELIAWATEYKWLALEICEG